MATSCPKPGWLARRSTSNRPDEPLTPCGIGDRCLLVASYSAVIQVAQKMGRAVHCTAITIITIEVRED
jgi:hypothetical protein